MIRSAKCHLANSTFKWDQDVYDGTEQDGLGSEPSWCGGGGRFLSAVQAVTCDVSTFPEKE